MAEIVLVHGIAQQTKNAQELEEAWLPALAKGVIAAGFHDVGRRIWSDAKGGGVIDTRMAFYGGLFLTHGEQGVGTGELSDPEFAEQLAEAWLRHVVNRSSNAQQRDIAKRELNLLTSDVGVAQGPRELGRKALKSLAKIRWFAPYGMAFAETFVWKALNQVTRYLTDETIRRDAKATVKALIGPETKVVIGHSLGSVVAFETVHELDGSLPLFITIGSPLGFDTIIYAKLQPQPPRFPPKVGRWVNVADKDDYIAAEPNLTNLFKEGIPAGAVLEGGYTVDNGAEPHSSNFYLSKSEVGRPVGNLLRHTASAITRQEG